MELVKLNASLPGKQVPHGVTVLIATKHPVATVESTMPIVSFEERHNLFFYKVLCFYRMHTADSFSFYSSKDSFSALLTTTKAPRLISVQKDNIGELPFQKKVVLLAHQYIAPLD